MKPIQFHAAQPVVTFAFAALSILLTGCGITTANTATTPSSVNGQAKMNGSVRGGQQPIAGAAIGLYIASIKTYQDPISNILKVPVLSDVNGAFRITGDFSCVAGDQLYITAIGGDPGGGVNANSALMAALGDCNTLTPDRFISINEVTTVASVFALAPFMAGATAMGTSGNNIQGLVRAFASAHKLVNTTTGIAPGDKLPAGAVAPTATINTLANVIAGCINSTGDTGAGSYCHMLFASVTPAGGIVPTDTISAALLMSKNPTLSVSAIYANIPATSPFQPMLMKSPNDWTLAVTYTAGGFNGPTSTSVDQAGNIWVANAGNNTVTLLTQAGQPTVFSGNGLMTPTSVAIDATGNAWIANSTGTSLSAFATDGTPVTGSPFINAGVNLPVALAFDATGNLWVANSGNNSVSELSAGGAALQQINNQTTPTAVAIDPR